MLFAFLIFFRKLGMKKLERFYVAWKSLSENTSFPLRWYRMYSENYRNFVIYIWDERVHQSMFTNNSSKDVSVTLDECEKLYLSPGQSNWITNPMLIPQI